MAKRSGELKELRGLRSDEELSSHPTHMSCVVRTVSVSTKSVLRAMCGPLSGADQPNVKCLALKWSLQSSAKSALN